MSRMDAATRIPVMMYHHIGPAAPDAHPALTVAPESFEAQLRFLQRSGYTGIRISDWSAWLRHGTPLPAKPVLLTFDDAYADLATYAFPLLERYGFAGLVFVVTKCIGKGNAWNQDLGFKWWPCLTADQIRRWSKRGIDFGAHSRNHPDLTQLAEPDLTSEIAGSRSDLEALTGLPVISFAYPYGLVNEAAAECVGKSFEFGFTTAERLNEFGTDRRLLHRNIVYSWDTPLDLKFLLRMGWNPLRHLRARFGLGLRTRFRKLVRKQASGSGVL